MEEFKHRDDMIWFAFLNVYSGYAGENDLEGKGWSSRTSLKAVTYLRWKMMVAWKEINGSRIGKKLNLFCRDYLL